MKDLLPCPFCGGEARLTHDSTGWWHIGCSDTSCIAAWNRAPAVHTEAEAIAAWNKRAERTCKLTFGKDNLPECGNCGEPLSYYTSRHGLEPKNRRSAYFCPKCGAKVVQ